MKTILMTEKDGVRTLKLARPKWGNAISVEMVQDLNEAFTRLEDDKNVRALVIRGDGDDFSKGIDLRDFPADGKVDVYGFSKWEKTVRFLERLPFPTIAVLHGQAAGGGFQLALACDARIVAADAVLHFHEAKMGFLPGMSVFRLAKFIGLGRARRLIGTGRKIGAEEALSLGLADFTCKLPDLDATIDTALAEFDGSSPEAIALARRLLDESFELSYEDFLGGFLAAQHRAARLGPFTDLVKKAHATDTPQGEDD